MKTMKLAMGGLAAAAMVFGAALAADFGPMPANYEGAATQYVSTRLTDPRTARYQVVGRPYKVYADIGGYEGLPAWAVAMRVKARLPSGGQGGTQRYTVIFIDGQPVALRDDIRRMARL